MYVGLVAEHRIGHERIGVIEEAVVLEITKSLGQFGAAHKVHGEHHTLFPLWSFIPAEQETEEGATSHPLFHLHHGDRDGSDHHHAQDELVELHHHEHVLHLPGLGGIEHAELAHLERPRNEQQHHGEHVHQQHLAQELERHGQRTKATAEEELLQDAGP